MRQINYNSHLGDPCEIPNCLNIADFAVFSRKLGEVVLCCADHAQETLQEYHPEYTTACQNCDCLLPIN